MASWHPGREQKHLWNLKQLINIQSTEDPNAWPLVASGESGATAAAGPDSQGAAGAADAEAGRALQGHAHIETSHGLISRVNVALLRAAFYFISLQFG